MFQIAHKMVVSIQRTLELRVLSFTIYILKICEFYLYSKYFGNQNISQDSRNSGEFWWYIIFRKSFFKLGKTSKKQHILPKIGKY